MYEFKNFVAPGRGSLKRISSHDMLAGLAIIVGIALPTAWVRPIGLELPPEGSLDWEPAGSDQVIS